MSSPSPTRLETISDLHRFNNMAPPEHPLISLIDYSKINPSPTNNELKWVQQFYTISIKRDVVGKYRYGQQSYDFDQGVMTFFAPEQVISVQLIEEDEHSNPSGWILAIHPDFLYGTSLATNIKKYSFLNYSVREALFLSEKEETTVNGILQNIQTEYQTNLDHYSQQIIISQLELLLSYADRYYHRQFLTRKIHNHQVLDRLEKLLDDHFSRNDSSDDGLPTVNKVAQELNLTPDYLSSVLKNVIGLTTQQLIHNKLIAAAKVSLSTTNQSISEIAYGLGFEHSQSFSKLFKSKTNQTPREFRTSFN